MKQSKLKLAFLLFVGMLALTQAQAQTAVATVDETIVYDYGKDGYISSKDDLVEQPYTHVNIYEGANRKSISFSLNYVDGSPSLDSEYKIIKRRNKSTLIYCERMSDGNKILIEQSRNRITINCDYNEKHDRFDSAIKFSKLRFRKVG